MIAEVMPGYKQTEVGVIPADWKIHQLVEISSSIASGRSKVDTEFGQFPVFGSTGVIGYTNTPSHTGESILVARVGANAGFLNSADGRYGVTDNTIAIRLKPGSDHIYCLLQLKRYGLGRLIFGSGQPLITGTQLKGIPIPTPAPEEQVKIVSALSEIDALIRTMDQLIAKKRDIQQAAMQQLLTGQRRLPGFSGEWAVKRLGDHLSFLRNGTNSRAELSTEGDVHYLHYGDIHGSQHLLLNPAKTSMPCLPRDKAKRLDRLNNGDLVFADASEDLDGVGKSAEVQLPEDMELVAGLHTIAVRFDKKVMTDGFKAYLQFIPKFRSHLRQLAAGTKVYATNRAHIASAELKIPGIEEQAAIATILSDMDAELAALETRRDKACQLKQGMMQELLTGRIRLTNQGV